MTTYTFKPKASAQFVSWDDPTVWTSGVVPNSPDADVVFPLVTNVSNGSSYNSYVTIGSNESFSTRSIQLDRSDDLLVDGRLSVFGDFNAGGEIDFQTGGSITAGSLEINGSGVQGNGTITAGSVVNDTSVVDGVTINAATFTNNGSLQTSSSNLSVSTSPNGFSTLTNGTLTGGLYSAGSSSTLSINDGQLISTDSAFVMLGGGMIQSFDGSSGTAVPITSSLKAISSSGTLAISNTIYAFGPLTVAGTVSLSNYNGFMVANSAGTLGLTSSALTIATGGLLSGYGVVGGPIDNEALIKAGLDPVLGASGAQQRTLTLNGPVTGAGRLEISAGTAASRFNGLATAELELTGSASQTVTFDNNIGTLALAAPSTFAGKIAPAAQAGDQIVFENVARQTILSSSYAGDSSGGTLTLQQANGSFSLNFVGDYNAASFSLANGPQQLSSDPPSTMITVGAPVCFAAGTLILTTRGMVSIENLSVHEHVVTSTGRHRAIQWLGHRTIACDRHPRRHEVLPICIMAHAFGENRPARNLLVSPGHAICIDLIGEVLIPAAALVNGTTIMQVDVKKITYWHVELESHDVILAENLPCESYLELGNRAFFTHGAATTTLHASPDAMRTSRASFCRPFHEDGKVVDFVRQRLAENSSRLGWCFVDEPLADIHLFVDGVRREPVLQSNSARFDLPCEAVDVWLRSETTIPAQVGAGADLRTLGVCVSAIVIHDGYAGERTFLADDPRFCVGFHDCESGPQRWTNGRAQIPSALWAGCSGNVSLRVDLARLALPRWTREITHERAVFDGERVGGGMVEEEAIVRNDHGAAGVTGRRDLQRA